MKGINLTRVLVGGLAAGVLLNVTEFVLWGVLLQDTYQSVMATHAMAQTGWAMAAYVIVTFVIGLALAFTYAAFRPRFGAGWQTAVAAAAVIWVVGSVIPMIGNAAVGIGMGAGASLLALAWGAVELALASVMAGWLYREQEVQAAAAARAY